MQLGCLFGRQLDHWFRHAFESFDPRSVFVGRHRLHRGRGFGHDGQLQGLNLPFKLGDAVT
jgi:hypothetical protein